MKLKGPYKTTISIHVTDGKSAGTVDIALSTGEPPTQQHIDECIEKAKEVAEEAGMRLMNKGEFFHAILRERTGSRERFAVPGGDEWDS